LADLQAIERKAGRDRRVRWAARTLDLDLLDGFAPSETLLATVPHPRMMERAFVLRPLLDVAPDWVHPVTGVSAQSALADQSELGVTASDGRAEEPS
jgi:2-amino-4-hydroxy-6-hydroxymethyldihydropteridine diphosphokinase